MSLLLFTTWLGVRGLNLDAINYDEHWTIRIIGAEPYEPDSLSALLANATEDPWQPPLYYMLLWFWSQFSGATPYALRFFTTLIGLLSVASAYQLGKSLFGRSAGFYSAILLGSSSLLAIYLHELRPYALYILFTILVLWAYWRSIHTAKFGWRGGFFLFFSLAGLIYSHYFSIVVIFAVGLYHLIFVPKNRRWWQIVAASLGAGATFLLWLPVLLQALQYSAAGGREGTIMSAGEVLVNAAYAIGNGWLPAIGLAVLLILGVGEGRGGRFLLMVGGVALGAALAINVVQPIITHVRYIIPLLPILLTLAAAGLVRVGRISRLLPGILLLIWLGFSFANTLSFTYDDTVYRDIHVEIFKPHLPVHEMVDWLREQVSARDAVIFHVPQHPWAVAGAFDYGMYGAPGRYIMLYQVLPDEGGNLSAAVQDYVVGAGRVWVALETSDSPLDSYHVLLETLDQQGYQACSTFAGLRDLEFTLYARYPIYCDLTVQPMVSFSESVSLTAITLQETITGETLRIPMTWMTENIPADTYSLALHLVNGAGEIVAQQDVRLPRGASAYRTVSVDVSDVAPGDYTLYLTVYEWRTGVRLPADTAADENGRYRVGTVQIMR